MTQLRINNLISCFVFVVAVSLSASCLTGSSAGNPPARVPQNVPEEAKRLNDSAVKLIIGGAHDSIRYAQALVLLREAVSIDSNYYYGYYHKAMCENYFKMYDSVLVTSLQLLRIRESLESYSMVGMCYDRTGDSAKAEKYYLRSLEISQAVLDTLQPNLTTWPAVKMNEIATLTLLKRKSESADAIDEAVAGCSDTMYQNYFRKMKLLSREDLILRSEKMSQ